MFWGGGVRATQGGNLSALVKAITPLVLASELAFGDADVKTKAVATANGGGVMGCGEQEQDGELTEGMRSERGVGFAPSTLRPLSKMSEEEQQVDLLPCILFLYGL